MKNRGAGIIAIIGCMLILVLIIVATVVHTKADAQILQNTILTKNYTYAILMRADGEQIIPLKSYRFKNGDMIEFFSPDGQPYLTHSSRVILTTEID